MKTKTVLLRSSALMLSPADARAISSTRSTYLLENRPLPMAVLDNADDGINSNLTTLVASGNKFFRVIHP
jgi:hypothetical protein